MEKILDKTQFFYKRWISPIFEVYFGTKCRFHPTCSEYFFESIKKNGFFFGGIKGVYRIFRCNPFFKGGFDPVSQGKKGRNLEIRRHKL